MKLLTKENIKKLPDLGKGDGTAYVKLFTPDANWTWYICEFNEKEDLFFGLVDGLEKELGYFSFSELKKVRGKLGLPIERDRYWKPQKVYATEPFKYLV